MSSTLERWFTKDFREKEKDAVRASRIDSGDAGPRRLLPRHFEFNTTARLKEIKRPVLAITGAQDAAAPGTRYIGENVPGAETVVIPQAAHIANIEQAEAFNRALREFLSSPPAGELSGVHAEEVEHARYRVRDKLVERLRSRVERRYRREHDPPISVTATMLRRCARLSGVSRGTSTRRRRSLRTTSAALETRSSACACATAASVFIEQGAITMPSVRYEPLEIVAAMSFG